LASCLAGLAIVTSACGLGVPALAQNAPTRPAQIDRNGVLILIRSALTALDQANKTGNYTVLRDLGAPAFRVNTAARLAEIFGKQRADNLDLSGVTAIEPQLTVMPELGANNLMRMAGFFPSVPAQINFELVFAPVDGQWRLFGLTVALAQTAPVPPAPPPAAAAVHKPAPAKKPPPPARKPPAAN
jgi:hypothetical protein